MMASSRRETDVSNRDVLSSGAVLQQNGMFHHYFFFRTAIVTYVFGVRTLSSSASVYNNCTG